MQAPALGGLAALFTRPALAIPAGNHIEPKQVWRNRGDLRHCKSIKFNEEFRDDGRECLAKIGLRFVLLIILEDLEQSRLLQVGRSKTLSFSQLERQR
jgi:hypothetical protein